MSHDQHFKNLVLDFSREALALFAAAEAAMLDTDARILPVRQEQLQEHLGERFRLLPTRRGRNAWEALQRRVRKGRWNDRGCAETVACRRDQVRLGRSGAGRGREARVADGKPE